MVPVALRMIWEAKGRFAIAVLGIGFTVMLMLFLLGVYQGVKSGSTSYVLHTDAEIWVGQRNSRNLIKTSSFLTESVGKQLARTPGVKSVDPILRTIAPVEFDTGNVTLFIFGFDTETQAGAPEIIRGTSQLRSGEIILDKAFAALHHLEVGDSIPIQDKSFKIVGICEGTNLIVGQFAFVPIQDVPPLLGLRNVRSFYLLNLEENSEEILSRLKEQFPDLLFTPKSEFAANNLAEMEIGVLPILWTIVLFGAITGATVIVLMMYTSVLEKREEYAMLKAVGASQNFLSGLVLRQSMLASVMGFALGLATDLLCAPLLKQVIPALLLVFAWQDIAAVFLGALVLGAFGTWAPIRTLKNIYPAEVFRA